VGRVDDREQLIWDRVAFIGRYGHQSAEWQLTRSLDELKMFAESLNRLLAEEHRMPGEHGED